MTFAKSAIVTLAFAATLAHGQVCITTTPLAGDYSSVGLLQDNGLAIVGRKEKYGLINGEGLVIAAPQYDKIWQHQGNRALFMQGERYGYLDERGKVAIAAQYDEARFFAEDLAAVKKGAQWGYIDRDGKAIIAAQYDEVSDFSEGLAAVRRDGQWQWIDATGKSVAAIDGDYGHIQPLKNGVAIAVGHSGNRTAKSLADAVGLAASDNSREYLVNREGKRLTDGDFLLQASECAPDAPLRFKKEREALWGLYDHDGREILAPTYDTVGYFCDGLADVHRDKHKAYIDDQGREVITPGYEYISPFSDGLAAVEKDGLTGYIDRDGREIIAPQFARGERFEGGFAAIRDDKRDWGLIDRRGNIVLEPAYLILHTPFANGRSFAAKADGAWFILDASGCKE
ncbi:MAG: WG repeat-containing protein [Cardiobacteriaceae bacterium]|nr:WG repeat-containing protein [Cardiobacteriaceae bacterium]